MYRFKRIETNKCIHTQAHTDTKHKITHAQENRTSHVLAVFGLQCDWYPVDHNRSAACKQAKWSSGQDECWNVRIQVVSFHACATPGQGSSTLLGAKANLKCLSQPRYGFTAHSLESPGTVSHPSLSSGMCCQCSPTCWQRMENRQTLLRNSK